MLDRLKIEQLKENVSPEVPARPPRWRWVLLGTLVVSLGLALLPHRTEIPPNIESDYCYLLLAADRFHDGQGLTSLAPQAPHQPWEWRYDWGWLTQWPIGYPLLVAGVRRVLGGTTINACLWINLAACALALVGWFAWVRYCAPRGVGSWFAGGSGRGLCRLDRDLHQSNDGHPVGSFDPSGIVLRRACLAVCRFWARVGRMR